MPMQRPLLLLRQQIPRHVSELGRRAVVVGEWRFCGDAVSSLMTSNGTSGHPRCLASLAHLPPLRSTSRGHLHLININMLLLLGVVALRSFHVSSDSASCSSGAVPTPSTITCACRRSALAAVTAAVIPKREERRAVIDGFMIPLVVVLLLPPPPLLPSGPTAVVPPLTADGAVW